MEIDRLIKKYFPEDFYSGRFVIKNNEKGLFVSYKEKNWNFQTNQTRFDIQVYRGICDINYLELRSDLKYQGYGKRFVDSIEGFCEELGGVELMRVTESGEGRGFWGRVGFVDVGNR